MSDLDAAAEIIEVVSEAIEEAGANGIPAGTLFAMLMQFGFTKDGFDMVINLLKAADKVSVSNHIIRSKS